MSMVRPRWCRRSRRRNGQREITDNRPQTNEYVVMELPAAPTMICRLVGLRRCVTRAMQGGQKPRRACVDGVVDWIFVRRW